MAVEPDDPGVWVGAGQEIAHIDPATATVKAYPLPSVPSSPKPAAYLRAAVRSLHAVVGIAVFGSKVAVARRAASAVQIFDSDTDSWSTLSLPAGTEAIDGTPYSVAYDSAGGLAVALDDFNQTPATPHEVLLSTSDKIHTVAVPEFTGFVTGAPQEAS